MEERIEACLGKVPADILIHGELVAREERVPIYNPNSLKLLLGHTSNLSNKRQ